MTPIERMREILDNYVIIPATEMKLILNMIESNYAPVVRCKDCRFYEKGDSGWWCKRAITLVPHPNGYCSWGKPREGSDK